MFHVNVTNNQKENNECCYSPEVELGGGRVRRNLPIAIFGIQPGQYQSRKENYWIKACLRYKVTRIMIISDSTSIKVSGMVTAQRQRSDSARLAIKTFLHNFFLIPSSYMIVSMKYHKVSITKFSKSLLMLPKKIFPHESYLISCIRGKIPVLLSSAWLIA